MEGEESDTVQQICKKYKEQTAQVQTETLLNPQQPHPVITQKVLKCLFNPRPLMSSAGQSTSTPSIPIQRGLGIGKGSLHHEAAKRQDEPKPEAVLSAKKR